MSGLLIVIDGPSGSGKDTLIARLAKTLQSKGISPLILEEESLDNKRGEVLLARDQGKESGGTGDKEMAEVLTQHRAELYSQLALPRLEEGGLVIANRGEPATLAYQTARGEITMEEVWGKHRRLNIPIPDLVVITTCSVETSLKREEVDRSVSTLRNEREAAEGLSGKVSNEIGGNEKDKRLRRELIMRQYESAGKFLESQGVRVVFLDTESLTVDEEVSSVLKSVDDIILAS